MFKSWRAGSTKRNASFAGALNRQSTAVRSTFTTEVWLTFSRQAAPTAAREGALAALIRQRARQPKPPALPALRISNDAATQAGAEGQNKIKNKNKNKFEPAWQL
jgi:hypothetical protein